MDEAYHRRAATNTLTLALEAAAGRAVIPLEGKTPTTGATPHGVKDATRDPDVIRAMFRRAGSRATGYGIATGAASGIVVVDVDGPEAWAKAKRRGLTSGYVVKTGRAEGNGYHLYYVIPPGLKVKSSTIEPGLEIKGDGSYVVGPGSLHPTGSRYTVVKAGEPTPAPPGLLEAGSVNPTVNSPRAASGPVAVDVAGPPILEGTRDNTLARVAGRLHDGSRDLEALTGDLMAVNAARCTPPLDGREVAGIAASIYRRTPCKPAPTVTPRVRADVDYLASVERPIKGTGGATGWSIYRAGLDALAESGREHPEGITLSLDVRTWAQQAGCSKGAVSRHLRRSPLMRVIQPGRGRKAATVLFIVPQNEGHKVGHSSSGGGSLEQRTSRSVSPSALRRTLERLRWGPGRIGKSRAALLAALVECGGTLTRSEIAAKLGRKPASLRAPLRWLVEAGLLEREARGVYALPPDFARRVEDAREVGREPEADRLQIARHDRQREAFGLAWARGDVMSKERRARRDRDRLRPEEKHPAGTVADLERVPDPDPALVEALADYLHLNPTAVTEGPSWLAVALWAGDHVAGKPTPTAVAVALDVLRERRAA